MRTASSLLVSLALCGCVAIPSTQTNDAPKIAQATSEQVASCKLLGAVEGTSPLHGFFYAQGLENAKRESMDKAAALGGTHLVWSAPTAQLYRTGIVAQAYRCA